MLVNSSGAAHLRGFFVPISGAGWSCAAAQELFAQSQAGSLDETMSQVGQENAQQDDDPF
jgi:hypothetical protein